jgi:hypothetical protein
MTMPTTIDMANVCARAVRLCRAVAPDLAGLPLYIVPQSRLAADFGTADGCDGYTAPSLDLYAKDAIGSDWQGRGPCLVVNDITLAAECDPEDIETYFTAVVLHELAHILERPRPYRPRPAAVPERIKFEALVMANMVAGSPTPQEAQGAFRAHGNSFIRVALHLHRRAARRGTYIAPSLLCAGRPYGLSHARAYLEALGDEPRRLAKCAFREILSLPAPAAFAALWQSDLEHHAAVAAERRTV